MMEKGKFVVFLSRTVFLLPGSFTSNPQWPSRTHSILCYIALAFTVFNIYIFISNDNLLSSRSHQSQSDDGAGQDQGITNWTNHNVVVEGARFASSSIEFLGNIFVRLLAITQFHRIKSIVTQLQTMDSQGDQEGVWRWGWIRWTEYEKLYLGVIALSLFGRLTAAVGFYLKPMMPWFTVKALHLVLQVLISMETISEVATFSLLAFTSLFTYAIENCCKRSNLLIPHEIIDDSNDGDLMIVRRMKQSKNGKRNKCWVDENINTLQNLICNYFEISAVWEESSVITATLTLLIFLDQTVKFLLSVFSTITILVRFGFSGYLYLQLGVAVMSILKLVCVTNAAQRLSDVTMQLACEAKDLSVKAKDDMTTDMAEAAAMAIEYMMANPLKLQAVGFFSVSKSTLTSIAGVVTTFCVVLIQFHMQVLNIN